MIFSKIELTSLTVQNHSMSYLENPDKFKLKELILLQKTKIIVYLHRFFLEIPDLMSKSSIINNKSILKPQIMGLNQINQSINHLQ